MSERNASQGQPTQAIDWLFSHVTGNTTAAARGRGLAPAAPAAPAVPAGADLSEMQPPPAIKDSADLQAAYEWLQRERKRLEGYTQTQLARLQNDHHALVQLNYRNEAALIARSQELSRQEELLASQSRALQAQAQELSQREQGMSGQLAQWRKAQEDLAANRQLSAKVRQDAEAQLAMLESLKAETAALQKAREAAQADLEALAIALLEQGAARAKEQEYYAARQAQLEMRLDAADKAEAAARRREAEVDELEARLLKEIEEERRRLGEARSDREPRPTPSGQDPAPPARGNLPNYRPNPAGAAGNGMGPG